MIEQSETRPFKQTISTMNMEQVLDISKFEKMFASESAEISDAKADIIWTARFPELLSWWRGENQNAEINCEAVDYVIHWAIAQNLPSAPLCPIVNKVSLLLTTQYPHLQCLLDLFRHRAIPNYSWVILGPEKTQVQAHQDMYGTASWNLLTVGRKYWYFWPPNTANPTDTPEKIGFEQLPGELVWIPENWWHSVDYHSACLCISKNIVPERSFSEIYDIVKTHDPKFASILEAIDLMIHRKKAT